MASEWPNALHITDPIFCIPLANWIFRSVPFLFLLVDAISVSAFPHGGNDRPTPLKITVLNSVSCQIFARMYVCFHVSWPVRFFFIYSLLCADLCELFHRVVDPK